MSADSTPLAPQLAAQDFAGRCAVITGAGGCLGRAVAAILAQHDVRLVLLGRQKSALEALDDQLRALGARPSTLLCQDVTQGDIIDRLADSLLARFGGLDILIAAAAHPSTPTPLTHLSPAQWEETFAVNVTAPWRLLRSLDPLLRRSDAGRAVFVTCAEAQSLPAYRGAYAVSKSALEALVLSYAAELRATNVRANLFDPGRFMSPLSATAFPGQTAAETTPEQAAQALIQLTARSCTFQGRRLTQDDLGVSTQTLPLAGVPKAL